MRAAELRTAHATDRIALRGVRLRCLLDGLSQRTTIEQTYVNREEHAIEAIYTLPLPEGAAVCGFEVRTGDRVLTGTVDETKDARQTYDRAIAAGHGALMLTEQRPDIFTVHVGSLKPGQAVAIRLTYVAALEVVDRRIRLAFPTTVAPRYVTDTGAGADLLDTIIDGIQVNPPHVLHVPYGLTMAVDVRLGRPVRGMSSPSHAVRTEDLGQDRHSIELAEGCTRMDRDIVLELELAEDAEPRAQAGLGPDNAAYVAVTFVPDLEPADGAVRAPNEIIFVLDCSGSMEGPSIDQAKRALSLCLRSMSEGDVFNIYRFGSTFVTASPRPRPYDDAALRTALTWLNAADADLGGTELYAPLEHLFGSEGSPGRVRQVILLTDGQITNEAAVCRLCEQHQARHRIFTFGIGSACSASLVRGIARATRGASEFITGDERIEEKVLRTFSRLTAPVADQVEIEWHGADVEQAPRQAPVFFDGDALTVFGRCAGGMPERASLSCRTATGQHRWSVHLPEPTADDRLIATMWAREAIRDLEDEPGRSTPHSDGPVSRRLIELSRAHGVLCRLTSFIAVEHRCLEDRDAGRPELRRIPVMLAEGWGGIMAARSLGPDVACCHVPSCASHAFLHSSLRQAWSRTSRPRRDSRVDRDAFEPLHRLLTAQSAEGGFARPVDLDGLAEVGQLSTLTRCIGEALDHGGADHAAADRDRVAATLLALWILRSRFADRAAIWRGAERKALRYLTRTLGWPERRIDAVVEWLNKQCLTQP